LKGCLEQLKEISMIKSRRNFLRSLSMGAAAGAAVHWSGSIQAHAVEPDRTRQPDRFIRLNSNENAYGPSPKVASVIRSATDRVNRYPFMKCDELTQGIASFHRVKPEQVLFACGSTEILRVAACAFLGKGRQLVQANPTFEAIEGYAKSVGSKVLSLPLDPIFAHDLGGMLAHTGASTGLIYICNPNNPTASITARRDLESFIGQLPAATKVVIDEAYHDYALKSTRYASFIDRPLNDERVIVVRTFSTVYGLAGLRLGYAVASPKVIEKMRRFITQDGLKATAAEVAVAALDDTDGVEEFVRRNCDDRQEFFNQAIGRTLKPIDSQTNFVLMNVHHPAEEVIEHFRRHNILIGPHFPSLDTYIRVSLGTPEEMRAFWQTWDLLPWSKEFLGT
jgi:histidinol-phosphate aminotransferase